MSISEKLPITLIVITRNEAATLAQCLQSVPFVADKLVVDCGSTDATREIAIRPYKTNASRERNLQIRRETRRNRARWTIHGIRKSPAPEHEGQAVAPAKDVSVESYA